MRALIAPIRESHLATQATNLPHRESPPAGEQWRLPFQLQIPRSLAENGRILPMSASSTSSPASPSRTGGRAPRSPANPGSSPPKTPPSSPPSIWSPDSIPPAIAPAGGRWSSRRRLIPCSVRRLSAGMWGSWRFALGTALIGRSQFSPRGVSVQP